MRILFVEDESELNELACGQLERQGHEVVSVDNVKAAQAVLEEGVDAIDCVITDHRLPDGYGVAFCVQCRVRYPKLLLGVVSACLVPKDIELMEEYDIPFWVKPILYSQVANELKQLRDARRSELARNAPILRSTTNTGSAPLRPPTSTPRRSSLRGLFKKIFR